MSCEELGEGQVACICMQELYRILWCDADTDVKLCLWYLGYRRNKRVRVSSYLDSQQDGEEW